MLNCWTSSEIPPARVRNVSDLAGNIKVLLSYTNVVGVWRHATSLDDHLSEKITSFDPSTSQVQPQSTFKCDAYDLSTNLAADLRLLNVLTFRRRVQVVVRDGGLIEYTCVHPFISWNRDLVGQPSLSKPFLCYCCRLEWFMGKILQEALLPHPLHSQRHTIKSK